MKTKKKIIGREIKPLVYHFVDHFVNILWKKGQAKKGGADFKIED